MNKYFVLKKVIHKKFMLSSQTFWNGILKSSRTFAGCKGNTFFSDCIPLFCGMRIRKIVVTLRHGLFALPLHCVSYFSSKPSAPLAHPMRSYFDYCYMEYVGRVSDVFRMYRKENLIIFNMCENRGGFVGQK